MVDVKLYFDYCRGKIKLPADVDGINELTAWARNNFLLSRLLHEQSNSFDQDRRAPKRIRFEIAQDHKAFAVGDRRRLGFEANRLDRALMGRQYQAVLLKGGAYVLAGKKAGIGRRVSDIDILVDNSDLARAEKAILDAGWAYDDITDNPYDQVYYRHFMHELPPLRHKDRGSIVDVHHGLLPKTHRYQPKVSLMVDSAIAVEGTNLRRFSDIDLFIHASIHHLLDGEFSNAPRSILELIDLFEDINGQQQAVVERANQLGVLPAVSYAFALVREFSEELDDCTGKHSAIKGHSIVVVKAMIAQIRNAPDSLMYKVSRGILYVRSHYLRMPIIMLIKHAFSKVLRTIKQKYFFFRNKSKLRKSN